MGVAALAASLVVALAGCAELEPTSAPIPSAEASGGSSTDPSEAPSTDPAAAWLDGGRAIALVTWGSSSTACAPKAADVTAEGQTVTVALAGPPADTACTADFAPRATYVAVPDGVETTKDVTLSFRGDQFSGRVTLPGRTSSASGGAEDMMPSAGWFASDGIVLLTWGSSSCPPVVQDVAEKDGGATVSFVTDTTRACTRDLAPRLTVLEVTAPQDPTGFTLTLKGDGLDGTVAVAG